MEKIAMSHVVPKSNLLRYTTITLNRVESPKPDHFFAFSQPLGLCPERTKDPGGYGLSASKYMLLPLNFCNNMIIKAFL